MTSRTAAPIEISNGTLSAKLIPFGASLTDLRLSSTDMPLVLGYDDPAIYERDGQFMGAVVGRFANRIAQGQCAFGGRTLTLERNDAGTHHLHGGSNGYSQRSWKVDVVEPHKARFSLESPDGDSGYSGRILLSADYEILDASTLRLTLFAETDQDTIINICHHPYFNFAGGGAIDGHQLQIDSDLYLPSNATLVPTGKIEPVADGPFDFTTMKQVGRHPYNNTYCLHRKQCGKIRRAAALFGSGVTMEVWTTQPGLHFYNGYKLNGTQPGHLKHLYGAFSGLCLEAQAWPDSPNNEHFPSTVLLEGNKYEQTTEYRFATAVRVPPN